MLFEVEDWLRCRSSTMADWPIDQMLEAKGGATVSVVLPARDEQATVGTIVSKIRADLVERVPLVDEVVVIDSRSTDDTAAVAEAAGAHVVAQDDVLPNVPPLSGKGEALWKSLAATTGDLIVFIDSDLRNFSASFVTGLLGPLLTDPTVAYVKGYYDRPFVGPDGTRQADGGRVTELVARPLINLHWPVLAGIAQPLGGEYAGRRSILERLPFVTGYGVEMGLLLDILQIAGLNAMAQVDLGTRVHSHQSTADLGAMAGQIMLTVWSRLERHGRHVPLARPSTLLSQFRRSGDGHDIQIRDVNVDERPPMINLPAYVAAIGRDHSNVV